MVVVSGELTGIPVPAESVWFPLALDAVDEVEDCADPEAGSALTLPDPEDEVSAGNALGGKTNVMSWLVPSETVSLAPSAPKACQSRMISDESGVAILMVNPVASLLAIYALTAWPSGVSVTIG